MTGALTAAAAIATILLVLSAAGTIGKATASDPYRRGSWGILHRVSDRYRPMNPHERRWQTILLSGRDNASRWKDLIAEIGVLENLGGFEAIDDAPSAFDPDWVEDTITTLEQSIDHKMSQGAT